MAVTGKTILYKNWEKLHEGTKLIGLLPVIESGNDIFYTQIYSLFSAKYVKELTAGLDEKLSPAPSGYEQEYLTKRRDFGYESSQQERPIEYFLSSVSVHNRESRFNLC